MKCPVCHEDAVYTSHTVSSPADYTHRYVHCKSCGSIFQTVETIIPGTIKEKYYSESQVDLFKELHNTVKSTCGGKKTA